MSLLEIMVTLQIAAPRLRRSLIDSFFWIDVLLLTPTGLSAVSNRFHIYAVKYNNS